MNISVPLFDEFNNLFQKAVGYGAWDQGEPFKAILEFTDQFIKTFYETLDNSDKLFLYDLLYRYYGYMQHLYGKDDNFSSNLKLSILCGLIELVVQKKLKDNEKYYKLDEFLKRNIDTSLKYEGKVIHEMISSYNKSYGHRQSIRFFFDKAFSFEHIEKLLKYLERCPEWQDCDDLSKFIDMITGFRGGASHRLNLSSLYFLEEKLRLWDDDKFKTKPTFSINQFTSIVWLGVLRIFSKQDINIDHRFDFILSNKRHPFE